TDEAELAHATVLKAEAEGLAEVERLRKTDGWKEVDPYGYLSAGKLHRNFTAGTLKGKGKFALRPLLFHNADQTECVAILHIGERLSGHDLICHGGVLATLLDEMCARASIPSLPHKTGFTANLTLNYRSPVKVNQFIVIRSKLTKLEGRKAFAKARIESVDVDEEGKPKTVFVEATSLFVSPKN
ncbi:HotDog domain-containing protein, partial [Fimicolochytrium jonesii]|uniref:HotDog domain-containing protein n=1 Tax=Fimicolochytrium jonesii TaxID=1396493 RepID=UPI0022FE1EB7